MYSYGSPYVSLDPIRWLFRLFLLDKAPLVWYAYEFIDKIAIFVFIPVVFDQCAMLAWRLDFFFGRALIIAYHRFINCPRNRENEF